MQTPRSLAPRPIRRDCLGCYPPGTGRTTREKETVYPMSPHQARRQIAIETLPAVRLQCVGLPQDNLPYGLGVRVRKAFPLEHMQQFPSEANRVNCTVVLRHGETHSFQNSELCSKTPITQKDLSTSATQTPERRSFVICPSSWSEICCMKNYRKRVSDDRAPP